MALDSSGEGREKGRQKWTKEMGHGEHTRAIPHCRARAGSSNRKAPCPFRGPLPRAVNDGAPLDKKTREVEEMRVERNVQNISTFLTFTSTSIIGIAFRSAMQKAN